MMGILLTSLMNTLLNSGLSAGALHLSATGFKQVNASTRGWLLREEIDAMMTDNLGRHRY
jgi:hypothetical protein